uniref:ABC transporter ATP-binding protein n=1 Tax=Nodulisporium sp. TaxID=1897413 RepID=A0A2R4QF09_9PEZI|nr:ABC transporter ATP-binding protein [Nodulisporium sp.]
MLSIREIPIPVDCHERILVSIIKCQLTCTRSAPAECRNMNMYLVGDAGHNIANDDRNWNNNDETGDDNDNDAKEVTTSPRWTPRSQVKSIEKHAAANPPKSLLRIWELMTSIDLGLSLMSSRLLRPNI